MSYSMSYKYPKMRPKAEVFGSKTKALPSDGGYENWQNRLECSWASLWPRFCEVYAFDYQAALLRAMAVVGVHVNSWDGIFLAIVKGDAPFHDLGKSSYLGNIDSPYLYFRRKLIEKFSYINDPPTSPEWLSIYDCTQQMYLSDLGYAWENIHEDYYTPWRSTRYGQDSPEIVRLKLLGQQARREIDEVARLSGRYMRR